MEYVSKTVLKALLSVRCKCNFENKFLTSGYETMATENIKLASLQVLLESIIGRRHTPAVESNAHIFCLRYSDLPISEKRMLLRHIVTQYGFKNQNAKKAAESFLMHQDKEVELQLKAAERLKSSLEPCYNDAVNLIRKLDFGVKFLVDLRADLLELLHEIDLEDSGTNHLRALNSYLKSILSFSFSVGFLTLERITWDSSCDMLQKISDYEAVHPMRNWADLKRRVGLYRRCYVFTHSSMRKEPIVVLHTALTNSISSTISSIVAHQRLHPETDIKTTASSVEDPKKINAAIFYSITSTQKGLHGIELGNQLIKKVICEVIKEFPHITQLSSLSPIPGFRDWLLMEIKKVKEGESVLSSLFTEQERITVAEAINCNLVDVWSVLHKLFVLNRWIDNSKLTEHLQLPLLRICAHYLYREKRRSYALNSVAHFHLRNGAVLWRLNWLADLSPRGITNSCGIMVNYRYFIDETEGNSKQYVEDYNVKISDDVKCLLTPTLSHL